MRKSEDLGKITLGNARKVRMVEVDIYYDKKCGDNLYRCGLNELKKDREAVISCMVRVAIERMVKATKTKIGGK